MSANYNRPKPADKIAWRLRCVLRVSCMSCDRHLAPITLKDFADCVGVSYEVRIYKAIGRLRCSVCGQPPDIRVTDPFGSRR